MTSPQQPEPSSGGHGAGTRPPASPASPKPKRRAGQRPGLKRTGLAEEYAAKAGLHRTHDGRVDVLKQRWRHPGHRRKHRAGTCLPDRVHHHPGPDPVAGGRAGLGRGLHGGSARPTEAVDPGPRRCRGRGHLGLARQHHREGRRLLPAGSSPTSRTSSRW